MAACVLLLVAQDASALLLGRSRGAVLIGRPLDMTVQVTVEPGTDGDALCPAADLFYGEQRIRPPVARWEPAAGSQGVIRIQSPVPVDEPMITVYLRAGCGTASVARRYVMLSEPPPVSEPVAQSVPFAAPPPQQPLPLPPLRRAARLQQPPVEGPPSAPAVQGRAGSGRSVAQSAAAAAPAAQAAPRAPARRDNAASRADQAARRPSRARLRLEPIDLLVEPEPALRLATTLSDPAAQPKDREAATRMWSVLRQTPEEAVQASLRLGTLEGELKSLQEVTRSNTAVLGEMRQLAEKARSERNQLAVVLALLLAMVLAAALWVGWSWQRGRRSAGAQRWFEPGLTDAAPLARSPEPATADKAAAGTGDTQQSSLVGPLFGPVMAEGDGRVRGGAPSFWPSVDPRAEFHNSQGVSLRIVGIDELLDVCERADFFVRIGEHGQAAALLETHVHDYVETSPHAWLELLDLYHAQGQRDEFERVRKDFRAMQHAEVPGFDAFGQADGGLARHERLVARITSLWPRQRVLEVIEEAVFRKPAPSGEPFELETYRDLAFLYRLAREIDAGPAVDPYDRTMIVPNGFAHVEPGISHDDVMTLEKLENIEPLDMLLVPPTSSNLGVDIDLEDLSQPEPSSLPALDFDTSLFDDLPAGDVKPKGKGKP